MNKQRNINRCFHTINKIYLFLHSSHIFHLKVSNIWLGWCVFGIGIKLPLKKHSNMGSRIVLTIGIKCKSWAHCLLTLHILGSATIKPFMELSIYTAITFCCIPLSLLFSVITWSEGFSLGASGDCCLPEGETHSYIPKWYRPSLWGL